MAYLAAASYDVEKLGAAFMRTTDRSHSAEPPTGHDPELVAPRSARRRRAAGVSREYQRLVANPFLALVVFLFAFEAFLSLVTIEGMPALIPASVALASVAFPLLVLHYHCLDCGKTGWLFRWKRHGCDTVLARQDSGVRRRLPMPSPTAQTVVWAYVFLGAVLIAVIIRVDLH
jgi:hypothetical protein